ncbi:MAG: xanthine dehydrogenase family protein molybdopterin-binding subunit [bacterium]|nr:xanthine dehydrogenase family protein molybdopterin-binding subunit [bacterium]
MGDPDGGRARSLIGESVLRLEDRPLLVGEGRFLADVSFPDELHLRVVRSDTAHGLLRGVDLGEVREAEGVVAAWSAEEVAHLGAIEFRMTGFDELRPHCQRVLAAERVRYVGDPVAVVIAEDAYLAEDAAELAFVDVEPLEPVLEAWSPEAIAPLTLEHEHGDVEAAFAGAHRVVELEAAVGRHSGIPLETRGLLARPVDGDGQQGNRVELYGIAKVPHYNCATIAAMLDLAPGQVVGREGHVGGGFGIRGELYPEDLLVTYAALKLGRPVKWVEDRREHLLAANHSRDQSYRVRAAVDGAGVVQALAAEFFCDQGGYVRPHGATVPNLSVALLPGPYLVPAYRVRGHIRLTNKTPAGTYRAPGRFESTFVRERLMDAVATACGLDPAEVRRRNLIPPEAMPFDRGVSTLSTPVVYDSGDYARLLERLLDHIGHGSLRESLAERRAAGEMVGLGIGMFVEKSGLGPFDDVRVRRTEGGGVEVVTGAASVGQGMETVIAQICAEVLGVDYGDVTVRHGQTDMIGRGMGAFASRVTVMTGVAVYLAATELAATGRPADATFNADHMTYPYGAHAAVVSVDADTGGVTVERYVVAYDVGRAVNPMLCEGQIIGGVAQGVGGALLELFSYDADGQPLATSFMDYLMPTAAEQPQVEVLLSEDAPSPLNPLGLKGAGEGGTNACGAAIAAAIDDAIGRPGAVTTLPATPESVRSLIRGAATRRLPRPPEVKQADRADPKTHLSICPRAPL